MPVPLNKTSNYETLKELSKKNISLQTLLNPKRIQSYQIRNNPLTYHYSTSLTNKAVLTQLQKLSEEQEVTQQFKDLLKGKIVNKSEKKPVLHHQCRHSNQRGIYGKEQQEFSSFSNAVRKETYLGFSRKATEIIVFA